MNNFFEKPLCLNFTNNNLFFGKKTNTTEVEHSTCSQENGSAFSDFIDYIKNGDKYVQESYDRFTSYILDSIENENSAYNNDLPSFADKKRCEGSTEAKKILYEERQVYLDNLPIKSEKDSGARNEK